MSVRWFIALALVLGVATVSTSSYIWLYRTTLLARDGSRQIRIERQTLEQQLVQLENPDNREHIQGLHESLQELQIRLGEMLSQEIESPGIVSIAFEQSVLADHIPSETTSDVVILRLEVILTARHSAAILSFLSDIQQSVVSWPNEVRACELDRLPASLISVQCVIDFYHWSDLGDQP